MLHQRSWLYPLFLLLITVSTLSAQHPQYDNQIVEKLTIIIEGSSDCDNRGEKSILSRIKTHEQDFFSQSDFDSDLKLLVSEFDNVEPLLESVNGKMHITLKVWPRPTIRSINWSGNKHITSDKLEKELGVKPPAVFDRLAFNKAFHKVKTYYVRKGYFEAELDYEILPCGDSKEVDINISIREGRAGHINKIIFRGVTKCEEGELLDLVHTKSYNLFFSWYTNEGVYHEEAIRHDQYIVLNYLQNKGYADAKVDINVEETANGKINIFINAHKGEIYRVGTIEFSGNVLMYDLDIEKHFTFQSGSPYSIEAIRETINAITTMYGKRGYLDAAVDFEPDLDIDTLTYNIKMTIEEGAQYRVGLIKVFGNSITQTNIILHESLLIPGQIFNIEKLRLTEQKLANVGYFESVNVYFVKSEGALGLGDNYRDVHIDVKETSTGSFGAFFGFSSSENLFGGLNITERNFNIAGLHSAGREGFRAMRGGGEYAHGSVQLGLRSRKYILSWAKPFFRDTQWTVGVDLDKGSNRYISDDYDIHSQNGTIHATYRINQFVHFGWHYRVGYSDIVFSDDYHRRVRREARETKKKDKLAAKAAKIAASATPAAATAEGVATQGDAAQPKDAPNHKGESDSSSSSETKEEREERLKGEEQKHHDQHIAGLISGTGISMTYDSTDHPVTPRSGFRSRLDLEFIGLGGDHTYFSMGYINSYFLPLDSKSVIRCRADFRFVIPLNGGAHSIPVNERLFLGGDSMVRGYRSYRLGPLYSGSDDPRGGISMQFYSVEIARRVHERVEGFVFCDAGYLTAKDFHFEFPHCAAGIGARIKVMEGFPAITCGYGIPLNSHVKKRRVKNFFISLGGKF
jgi:outer membrane protein insertion porin family